MYTRILITLGSLEDLLDHSRLGFIRLIEVYTEIGLNTRGYRKYIYII